MSCYLGVVDFRLWFLMAPSDLHPPRRLNMEPWNGYVNGTRSAEMHLILYSSRLLGWKEGDEIASHGFWYVKITVTIRVSTNS